MEHNMQALNILRQNIGKHMRQPYTACTRTYTRTHTHTHTNTCRWKKSEAEKINSKVRVKSEQISTTTREVKKKMGRESYKTKNKILRER